MTGHPVKDDRFADLSDRELPLRAENIGDVPLCRVGAMDRVPGIYAYMASKMPDDDVEYYLVRVLRWGQMFCTVRVLLTGEARCHVPVRALDPIVKA